MKQAFPLPTCSHYKTGLLDGCKYTVAGETIYSKQIALGQRFDTSNSGTNTPLEFTHARFPIHGFRNRGCQKGVFQGGIANCSKTATLFSARFGQALELVATEVLQKQPSDIIGYDWR